MSLVTKIDSQSNCNFPLPEKLTTRRHQFYYKSNSDNMKTQISYCPWQCCLSNHCCSCSYLCPNLCSCVILVWLFFVAVALLCCLCTASSVCVVLPRGVMHLGLCLSRPAFLKSFHCKWPRSSLLLSATVNAPTDLLAMKQDPACGCRC